MKFILPKTLMFCMLSVSFSLSSLPQTSMAIQNLPVMSEEQIPQDIMPRLLGNIWQVCVLDKKDNYIQFLQRIAFHNGQKGLGDLELVQKIAAAAVSKYKLEDKASCVDLAVGLLEVGIIDGKKPSVKIDFTDYRYRTTALRAIAGNIDKPELRAMATYQNNKVEVSFLLARMAREMVYTAIENQSHNLNVNDPKYILTH